MKKETAMKKLLSTREVAEYLGVNEKMVYTLVAEKGLPASKITGKWVFPVHLVDQWVEASTLNYPAGSKAPGIIDARLIVLAGSNDLLLEKTIALFNRARPDYLAVFANLGSMGGLRALRRDLCHIAASHLLQEDGADYNFEFANREFNQVPVMVNFCRREQGFLLAPGNPKGISGVADLKKQKIHVVNRSVGTGTRLLFDRELKKAGLDPQKIQGYHREVNSHMEVGLEVLSGRADMGPGIKPVAGLLGLDFIPLRWERYDLLVTRDRFFDKPVQNFLGILQDAEFKNIAGSLEGYDVSAAARMVYPQDASVA
jgi:putative molybdopterin biosynthesis protein